MGGEFDMSKVESKLAADNVRLEKLEERIEHLEKVVLHGNGSPPLQTQIIEVRTKVDTLEASVSSIGGIKNEIADINKRLTAIETSLEADRRNHSIWISTGLIMLTVLGEALARRFI